MHQRVFFVSHILCSPGKLHVSILLSSSSILTPLRPLLRCFGADLRWHTRISSTLPLTETTVTSNAAGGGQLSGAGTGVHGDWLADDEAISNQLADGLAGVGIGDLVDLVWVEPDLALSCTGDGCRQALLGGEVDPTRATMLVWVFILSRYVVLPVRAGRRSCRSRASAAVVPFVMCPFVVYGIEVVLTS